MPRRICAKGFKNRAEAADCDRQPRKAVGMAGDRSAKNEIGASCAAHL